MSFVEAKKIGDQIGGWLRDTEAKFLYNTARNSQWGVVVEIGSWLGKSTVYLAMGSKAGNRSKVYAIDPHRGGIEHERIAQNYSTFEKFLENIKKAGVEDIVIPLRKTSQEVAQNWSAPIKFLWIDGDHSYEGAKADFELYFPFVVEGGVIAFHDSTQGYVQRVVQEVFRLKQIKKIGLVGSITFGYKDTKREPGILDILQKNWILFFNEAHRYFWKIPLPSALRSKIRKTLKG